MIGGNKEMIIKVLDNVDDTFDENGSRIKSYIEKEPITGWLDLSSGDSKYDYKAKIEDSTHIFICDYVDLSGVDIEEARASIDGEDFELKYIDDPMGLNEHLEIYLKKVGGQ